jgi:hypothetical protein
VNWIGQEQIIGFWLGIELLPKTQPTLLASFGGKHVIGSWFVRLR